jgi:tRNA threonylcarbamoyladenosine biosynthesis protein TsaE
MKWNTQTIEEFEQAIIELFDLLNQNHQSDHALVIALHGDLGAGKTTATQIIGKILGITENMQSPTFVIKKIYQTNNPVFTRLVHMDAYRLEGESNIELFRLDDDFSDPNTIIIIEWPGIIESIIPNSAIYVTIDHVQEGRIITW